MKLRYRGGCGRLLEVRNAEEDHAVTDEKDADEILLPMPLLD